MMRRVHTILACGWLLTGLAGCQTVLAESPVETTPTVQDPLDAKYFPSDEPLRLGMEHFAPARGSARVFVGGCPTSRQERNCGSSKCAVSASSITERGP